MTYRATARPMQITFPKNSVEPVPPYWFCHDGDRSVYKEDENAVPFRYMFEEGDFDEDEYLRLHGNKVAWVGAWRDPDMDIIQAETVQRLKPYRLSAQQIDRTRILPSEHRVIFDLDLTRDLPPFPRATSVDMDGQDAQVSAHTNTNALFKAIPGKRKWELPLSLQEEQYEDNQDFYEENWCFRQNCWEADCTRHASLIDGVLYFSSFHYIAQPSEHIIMDKLAHTARPGDIETSCSDTCAKLRNEGSLLLASQQMRLRPNHEKEQKFLLDLILDGPEGKERLKPCDLRIVFPDHTCEEMAMRVMLLRREQEDLWRAKSLSSVPAPLELERAKSAVFKPAKYNAETRTFVECDHDGPCVKDVVRPIVRDSGKAVNAALESPQASVPLGTLSVNQINAHVGSFIESAILPSADHAVRREAEIERVQPLRAKKDNLSIREIHSASRVPLNGTCGNVEIQKGVYPRLRVGVSRVAGYGVFATEDLPRGTSIGEYVGEWISDAEGIRRDKVNSQIGRTYIFNLNADFEIDAANFGNYTRYFNSAKGSRANCETTHRKINRNEEIRFDYGKSFDENAVDMVTNIKAKRAKN
ncbi:hypothetical protein I316_02204 [Kwoniella heveanensis BCC8398]|uniref:SET domain-containing protein n=1 Tax=Kwoniella heveanensis BCC8398 TaxID=1296120 RepID=A0A1B9GZ93_9TREE|nr:hypothetical protein I316_02204 [Kwoniella heveanensis BCC8398]